MCIIFGRTLYIMLVEITHYANFEENCQIIILRGNVTKDWTIIFRFHALLKIEKYWDMLNF